MLLRKLLPVFLLFAVLHTTAQPVKNQPTSRILKTANTLLQAQQFEAAEEYFSTALKNATAAKNYYHQAQAYEGLGTVYSKLNQTTQAVDAYQRSIKLYRALDMAVIADVVNGMLKSVQGIGEVYAGVEIGAKGVKLSVIDVKMSRDGENDFTLKMDTSINSDAAALSYQSEKETHDAIRILYTIIRTKFQVPAARTHIVISSGLKQELDKYNKVEYFANVIRPKELDPKIRIGYITVDQEAELSFKGIVPSINRLTANQIDVGSGNTKGGYISSNRNFIPVTFPLGTKSFQRLVEEKIPAGSTKMDDYLRTAEKIIIDSIGRTIVYQFRDKTDFKSRDMVYISGGIVWCIASLMHPDQIRQNQVELTPQDIAEFRKLVYSDYDKLIKPDLRGMSYSDQQASQANINRAVKTYDQKALLAGTIWLDEVVKEINKINTNKKFIFPRYAYVGWISGYIMDKISKQYTGLAAK
jgi:tetratricopeptide (TPR) repeat protein